MSWWLKDHLQSIDKNYLRVVFIKTSKTIQYQIMMDKFDSQYAVKIKESMFPEYNNNKLIYRQIAYFLDDDYK